MLDIPSAAEQYNRARELRRRRLNPPGGIVSSELEVLPPHLYRQRVQYQIAEKEVERKLGEARSRQRDLDRQLRLSQARADSLSAQVDKLKKDVSDLATTQPHMPKLPRLRSIMIAVCEFYLVPVVDIVSSRRTAIIVRPRQVVCFLARKMTTLSLPAIGRQIGNRDHTTVMHAVNNIERRMEFDRELADEVDYLCVCLTS